MAQTRDAKGRFTSNKNGKSNGFNPLTFNRELAWITQNARSMRDELMRKILDPRRNIDDECGYPTELNVDLYRKLYEREAVAARVVEVLPQESWVLNPNVFEDEDPTVETEFEAAWNNLNSILNPNTWLKQEDGGEVWEYLTRVDILSGIGSFGLLLIGFDDGKDLSEPVEPSSNLGVIFIRAVDEYLVDIASYEVDKTNPRYGHPTAYNIRLHDQSLTDQGGLGLDISTAKVHWTRVVHVADNLGSSEIFGRPRMMQVYDRLYDLRKLYAGSAEMYWRGAFPGISLESHPQLGADLELSTTETDAIRDTMENYHNGLQRYLLNIGMSAKSLAPQVVDPTPQINTQIEAICIKLGIPKRIFCGSERGELASGQDDSTWNDRLRFRQRYYLTPRVVSPFIDRLIMLGVLPEPKDGYVIKWPDLNNLTDDEIATVAGKRTEALAKYVAGNVANLIDPIPFLTSVMGMTVEEAEALVRDGLEDDLLDEGIDDGQEEQEIRASTRPDTGRDREDENSTEG